MNNKYLIYLIGPVWRSTNAPPSVLYIRIKALYLTLCNYIARSPFLWLSIIYQTQLTKLLPTPRMSPCPQVLLARARRATVSLK